MRNRLYVFVVTAVMAAILVTSCKAQGNAARPKYPARLSPDIQQRFNEADNLYRAGSLDAADRSFAGFISEFEYNELTDEARFKRGEIAHQRKRYAEALSFYRGATAGLYNPQIASRAHVKAARCLYFLKRYGEAIDELAAIVRPDTSPALKVQADSLGMLAARGAGWTGKRIVRFSLFLVDDYIDLAGATASIAGQPDIIPQQTALDFVRYWVKDDTVTEEDLQSLPPEAYAKKPSGGYVLYKQALVKQRYGDFKGAAKLFRKFTNSYPKNEYYEQAQAMLAESSVRAGKARFKIGVILPLSGRYRIYGESVLHGIECALGIYKPCEGPADVQMVVKDSRGDSQAAADAVAELAAENVEAIIGPLLSATVMRAAEKAQQLGIPLITLSQREGVAAIGDYVFRNSVTSKSEVDSLVEYAARTKNLKRYAVLYPDNRKGIEFKNLFVEGVRATGGRVVSTRSYNPRSQDLTNEVRGLNSPEGTIDLTQSEGRSTFDALFLPDSSWAAAYIAPLLSMMGLEGVQLLGTMRWNDPDLIKRGGKYLEGAIYVVAFDAGDRNAQIHDFVDRFSRAYGTTPTLLEALGFDSMKMINKAASEGAKGRLGLRDSISSLHDFPGITGRISVDGSGDMQRKLKLMAIRGGNAQALN